MTEPCKYCGAPERLEIPYVPPEKMDKLVQRNREAIEMSKDRR